MQRDARKRTPSLDERARPAPVDDAVIEVFINETDPARARYAARAMQMKQTINVLLAG